jgi:hypothetical protein
MALDSDLPLLAYLLDVANLEAAKIEAEAYENQESERRTA